MVGLFSGWIARFADEAAMPLTGLGLMVGIETTALFFTFDVTIWVPKPLGSSSTAVDCRICIIYAIYIIRQFTH